MSFPSDASLVFGIPILDKKSIIAEILNQEKVTVPMVSARVDEEIVNPALEKMANDFMEHPVTQEILGGVESDNISNTLGGFKYKGGDNLYSFIGFSESQEETIKKIRNILLAGAGGEQKQLRSATTGRFMGLSGGRAKYTGKTPDKGTLFFEISGPDETNIYKLTPMPWAPGLSWVHRMETGIPGLAYFMNMDGDEHKRESSRSGGGIQIKRPLRNTSFQGISYLSEIIDNFLKRCATAKL
jgi:hypothetical protein